MAPRQIALALYHRDHFSEGRMRQVFSYEAYHWAIIAMPSQSTGRVCWTFEATDANEINPVTFLMNNPTMGWWLKSKDNADPDLSSKLLGMVVIGETPNGLSFPEMKKIMRNVPLPVMHKNPQQICVTWADNAILTLQSEGWVQSFDIDLFKDWVLEYADERMKKDYSTRPRLVKYC